MRRDQPTTPFDVEADDLTQEFWGASKGWVSSEQPSVRRQRPAAASDTTGSLRAIRDGFAAFRPQTSAHATGEVRRQRQHGRSTSGPSQDVHTNGAGRREQMLRDDRREATLGELAAGRSDVGGWFDDPIEDSYDVGRSQSPSRGGRAARTRRDEPGDERWEDRSDDWSDDAEPGYDVPLSPVQPLVERLGLGAVDPLLVRAGAIALALILLVPVMLSLRPERADGTMSGDVVEAPQPAAGAATAPLESDPVTAGQTTDATTEVSPPPSTADAAESTAVTDASVVDTSVAAPTAVDAATDDMADDVAGTGDSTERTSADVTADEAAAVDVAAERLVPACPQTYTAAAGDSWYRIADQAGIDPDELLAENTATLATVILPGDDICLPEGARMPSPPTTTVAPVEDEPDPTPTTEAPPAPTTTVAPADNLSRSEVQDLIRATWPEDEVDTALAVADRESDFVATADNGWCCVGVFQIYWTVHRGWLDDFGIYERSDLFDARKNIAAAYHMWQTQGWGPWGG